VDGVEKALDISIAYAMDGMTVDESMAQNETMAGWIVGTKRGR
jgi:hypothetical protein